MKIIITGKNGENSSKHVDHMCTQDYLWLIMINQENICHVNDENNC